jgi:hypothetical protein
MDTQVLEKQEQPELHYHLPIYAIRRQDDYHITTIRKETLIMVVRLISYLKIFQGQMEFGEYGPTTSYT